jgi:hypothetical protein
LTGITHSNAAFTTALRAIAAPAVANESDENLASRIALKEFEIDTTFRDASGTECGRRPIRFIRMGARGDGSLHYRVDALDIDRLLVMLDGCVRP